MRNGQITYFQDEIDEYQAEFFEGSRQWLDELVDQFVADENCRRLIIIGEPGVGKSTYIAHLADKYECPRYFTRSRKELEVGTTWVDPKTFLITLGHQLGQKYGAEIIGDDLIIKGKVDIGRAKDHADAVGTEIEEVYLSPFRKLMIDGLVQAKEIGGEARLAGVRIRRLYDSTRNMEPYDLLHEAVLDPLKRLAELYPGEKVILLIDGLDVSSEKGGVQDVIPIAENLWVVITSRPGAHLAQFRSEEKIAVSETGDVDMDDETRNFTTQNRIDARNFVNHVILYDKIIEPAVRASDQITPREYIDLVTGRSDGNFLYLHYFFEALRGDIQQGMANFLTPEGVPRGLYDFYRAILIVRIMQDVNEERWEKIYVPVLGILAVAQEGLTREQIAGFARVKLNEVDSVRRRIGQFLDVFSEGGKEKYRIYHTSFSDYLLDSSNNRDYPLSGPEFHYQIASFYRRNQKRWEEVDWGQTKADPYPFRHLASHLEMANKKDELYSLINQGWMNAQIQQTNTLNSFASDVKVAIAVAESESPPNLPQFVRLCLIYATLASYVKEIPVAFLLMLAQFGQIERAITIAELIEEPIKRYKVHLLIADAFMTIHSKDKAKRFLKEALKAAQAIVVEKQKVEALGWIAQALAKVGDAESAVAAVEMIEDDKYKAQTLGAVAQAQAQAGDRAGLGRALAATETIKYEGNKARALVALALALVQIGDVEAALRASEAIKNFSDLEAMVLEAVLQVLADIRNVEVALAAAQRVITARAFIWDEESKNRAYEAVAHALASVENRTELDRALGAVEEINGDRLKVAALGGIAQALARVGDRAGLGRALAIAETVQEDWIKANALEAVAEALAQVGDKAGLARALEAAEMIEYGKFKAQAMGAVAHVLARAGEATKAQTANRKALAVAEMLKYDKEKAQALGAVAQTLAQLGDRAGLARALVAAKTIEEDKYKAQALGAVILALAQVGEAEVVLAEIRTVIAVIAARKYQSTWEYPLKTQAYEAAGQALANVKDRAGLARALAALDTVEDGQLKTQAYEVAAKVMGQAGDKAGLYQILEVAQTISPDWIKDQALRAVAQALAQIEDKAGLGRAIAAAEKIKNDNDKALALQIVIPALARARDGGGLSRALAAAEKIKDDRYKAETMVALVQALTHVGDGAALGQALAIAETIQEDWIKATALEAVAEALAQVGDKAGLARALTVVETIKDDQYIAERGYWIMGAEQKVGALGAIVQALAQVGDRAALARALIVAKTIQSRSGEEKGKALVTVVQALARVGDVDSALAAVETIENDEYKAQALEVMMLALAQGGDTEVQLAAVQRSVALVKKIKEDRPKFQALRAMMQILAQVKDEDAVLAEFQKNLISVGSTADEQAKAQALSTLAQAMVQVGDPGMAQKASRRALASAEVIKDDAAKDQTLGIVVRALAQAGELEAALPAMERIKDRGLKAKAYQAVVQVLAQRNNKAGLYQVLKQAKTNGIDPISLREQKAQAMKAEAYAQAESIGLRGVAAARYAMSQEAESSKEAAIDKPEFVLSLIDWVKVLAQAGDKAELGRVLETAKTIGDDREKVRVLEAVAQSMAQAGDRAGLNRVLVIAQSIYTDWLKASALTAVTQGLAQVGDGEAARGAAWIALEAAKATRDEQAKAYVLGLAAQVLAKIGDKKGLNQALAAGEAIHYEQAKAHALGKIAQALAQVGEVESAGRVVQEGLKVTERIENADRKVQSFVDLAQVLVQLGDLKTAQMVSQKAWAAFLDMVRPIASDPFTPGSITPPPYSHEQALQALKAVVQAMAQVGDRTSLVQALEYNRKYTEELRDSVAQALAQLGDIDKALEIAKEIEHEEEKARVLDAVAQVVAQRGNKGNFQGAIQIVESIPVNEYKTRALINLSLTFERLGDSTLALSNWRTALKTDCTAGKANFYQILSEGISGLSAFRHGETLANIDEIIEEVSGWLVLT
jgi:hypothetical protein